MSRSSYSCGVGVTFVLVIAVAIVHAEERPLKYQPAPVANPLKGLVPYSWLSKANRFPHSMEFEYIAFNKLMTGPNEFNWKPVEKILDAGASRRHQMVLRIWLEYPKQNGIPQFLEKRGLKVIEWTDDSGTFEGKLRTPDYKDPRLHKALKTFIAEFGKKYDGDSRIACITAGLIGNWGEWHNYPRAEIMPDKTLQTLVMNAYAAAFKKTHILLRYPAGPDNYHYASNHKRPFGYHDDSFAWATLDTGREQDDWFFIPALKRAKAIDRWKSFMIGAKCGPKSGQKSLTSKPKSNRLKALINACSRRMRVGSWKPACSKVNNQSRALKEPSRLSERWATNFMSAASVLNKHPRMLD